MNQCAKLLSLIIPSYNMERYLPKCLGSLIIDDPELLCLLDVIVVNDGSKDRTSEIAHEFASSYSEVVRVIDKPNGHYGSCINAALKVARGLYVKVLDADDWFDTEEFVKYLRHLTSFTGENSVDLVLNDFDWIDPDNRVTRRVRLGLKTGEALPFSDMPKQFDETIFMHSVAYQTGSLRSMNYVQSEGICHTDEEWLYMPMSSVRTFVSLGDNVYRYLVGRSGQSVDPQVCRRNFWMRRIIALKMLDQYCCFGSRLEERNVQYLRTRLKFNVLAYYSQVLLCQPIGRVNALLADYDAIVAKKAEVVYSEIATAMTVFDRSPLRFEYLRFWQRYHTLGLLGLLCVRAYVEINAKLRGAHGTH